MLIRALPCTPLFPYTTLFRSIHSSGMPMRRERACRPLRIRGQAMRFRVMVLASAVAALAACGTDEIGPTGFEPTEPRSEEHTSELQSRLHLVCRLLLEKKNKT